VIAAALSLVVTLSPAQAAPLEPVVVAIAVRNREKQAVTVESPSADLFFLQIRDDQIRDDQIRDEHGRARFDSRTGHKPIAIRRKMTFARGTTPLASFVWSGLGDDQRPLDGPAGYVVRVGIETAGGTIGGEASLRLTAPITIKAALAETSHNSVTVAGRPLPQSGGPPLLQDDSGSIALSRPLGFLPQGRFLVRGHVERTSSGVSFSVERSAPAPDNVTPFGSIAPRPSASALPK